MIRDSLFPINGVLPHDQYSLRILKRLSAGLTGEVYQGELVSDETGSIPVAVKVMKRLDFPQARQLFSQESVVLALMMHLEDQANREQRLSLKVAPLYYGRGEYGDRPYLVEEFIQGQKIPDLLGKHGRFPEAQALTAAWHLYRTLDVMHTRLKKSYIDLKFENLWWVSEGLNGGQLKLTDFGTLEDIKPDDAQQRGARRDVLLAAVYLCAMLTGYTLRYLLGELLERAEPVIRSADVSWGARDLLRRLLHHNPEVRPTEAGRVAGELRALVNFWAGPVDKALEAAQNNLSKSESESDPQSAKARDLASRARAALDIARLKAAGDEERLHAIEADIGRAEKLLSISDYLTRGKALFMGRSYALARQTFEQGMHWSDEPAVPRRWAYLASVGEAVSPSIFDEHREATIQALERLNEGHWDFAAERLATLATVLESPGLAALRADAKLFALLAQAEQAQVAEDFQKAAQAYRQAIAILNQLPDTDFVRREEVGDLLVKAEEVELLHRSKGEAQRLFIEARAALEAERADDAVRLADQAFNLYAEPLFRSQQLLTLTEAALQLNRLSVAPALAEIGLRSKPLSETLLIALDLAGQLRKAEQALAYRQSEVLLELLRDTLSRPAWQLLAVTLPCARTLMTRAEQQARATRDADLLRGLAILIETPPVQDKAWADDLTQVAETIEQEQAEHARSMIDRQLAMGTLLLDINDLAPARDPDAEQMRREYSLHFPDPLVRLKEAARLVNDAEIIGRGVYRPEDIRRLHARISASMSAVGPELLKRSEAEKARQRENLQRQWEQLTERLRRADHTVDQQLPAFVRDCATFLQKVDAADLIVLGLKEEALKATSGLGFSGWQNLMELARNELSHVYANYLEAQLAFAQGQFERTAEALERLSLNHSHEPDWKDLRIRLTQAEQWRAWQDAQASALRAAQPDPVLLKVIRSYLSLGLPAPFWNDSFGPLYLQQARKTVFGSLRDALKRWATAPFAEHLRLFLDIEFTTRFAHWATGRPDSVSLQTIRRCLHAQLPLPDEAHAYLHEALALAQQTLKVDMPRFRRPEFASRLRALLEVEWTARQVSSSLQKSSSR
jgi:hypothetical protein